MGTLQIKQLQSIYSSNDPNQGKPAGTNSSMSGQNSNRPTTMQFDGSKKRKISPPKRNQANKTVANCKSTRQSVSDPLQHVSVENQRVDQSLSLIQFVPNPDA